MRLFTLAPSEESTEMHSPLRKIQVWTTTLKISFNSIMLTGNDYSLLYNRVSERICRSGIAVADYAFIYVNIFRRARRWFLWDCCSTSICLEETLIYAQYLGRYARHGKHQLIKLSSSQSSPIKANPITYPGVVALRCAWGSIPVHFNRILFNIFFTQKVMVSYK